MNGSRQGQSDDNSLHVYSKSRTHLFLGFLSVINRTGAAIHLLQNQQFLLIYGNLNFFNNNFLLNFPTPMLTIVILLVERVALYKESKCNISWNDVASLSMLSRVSFSLKGWQSTLSPLSIATELF